MKKHTEITNAEIVDFAKEFCKQEKSLQEIAAELFAQGKFSSKKTGGSWKDSVRSALHNHPEFTTRLNGKQRLFKSHAAIKDLLRERWEQLKTKESK